MRTLLSSPCQLRLGVVLRYLSLSSYTTGGVLSIKCSDKL